MYGTGTSIDGGDGSEVRRRGSVPEIQVQVGGSLMQVHEW